jgi:hypothetical protein
MRIDLTKAIDAALEATMAGPAARPRYANAMAAGAVEIEQAVRKGIRQEISMAIVNNASPGELAGLRRALNIVDSGGR